MADSKISDLTATITFDDADLATTVQGGINKKISGASLKTVVGWERLGTDVIPKTSGDNINFGTGALKDNDVVIPISLGDSSNTSLITTNKTIVGAINEVKGDIPNAVEDDIAIAMDGDTVFTLSSTPSGDAAFELYLNGQLRKRGTDYTQSGTTLTWLDPSGLTLLTTDILIARYNNTAAVVLDPGPKEIFFQASFNSQNSSYKVQNIGANGSDRLTFKVPFDFTTLVDLVLVFIPSAMAAGPSKDIDLISQYAAAGEASNANSESDTTTLYDFTGQANQISENLGISSVFTSISAGDYGGIQIDHSLLGGPIDYLGIRMKYL